MNKVKRIGIIFVLVGIGLPIFAFGLVAPYSYHMQYGAIKNILTMKIVLREGEYPPPPPPPGIENFDSEIGEKYSSKKILQSEIAIPYRYFFIIGTVFLFTGIGMIALSNGKKGG